MTEKDIVQRLRASPYKLCLDAANEIERLRKTVDELEQEYQDEINREPQRD